MTILRSSHQPSPHIINMSNSDVPARLHPRTRKRKAETPEVSLLDHRIFTHGGTTSVIDSLPSQLNLRKRRAHPPPSKELEELTRENGYLREELALHQETRLAITKLHRKTIEAYQILQNALQEMSQKVATSEERLLQYWGIDIDEDASETVIL